MPTLPERFWAKVERSKGCWLWKGAKGARGYGVFWRAPFQTSAHRVAWELTYGPIPDGHVVMHLCDNPPCVNPEHLRIGTHLENMADMRAKGRWYLGLPRHVRGERCHKAKLTPAQVLELRRRFKAGERPWTMAKELGMDGSTIDALVKGRSWKHLPL